MHIRASRYPISDCMDFFCLPAIQGARIARLPVLFRPPLGCVRACPSHTRQLVGVSHAEKKGIHQRDCPVHTSRFMDGRKTYQ